MDELVALMAEVGPLQEELRTALRGLDGDEPGSGSYDQRVAEVIDTAGALIATEEMIPVLRDGRRRRRAHIAVWAVTGAAGLGMLGLGVAAGVGAFSRGYLVPVVLVLAAAVLTGLTEAGADLGHAMRLVGANLVLAVAAGVAAMMWHAISAWWLLAAIPLLLVALAVYFTAGADKPADHGDRPWEAR